MFKPPTGDNILNFTNIIDKAWNNNKELQIQDLEKEVENKVERIVRDLISKMNL